MTYRLTHALLILCAAALLFACDSKTKTAGKKQPSLVASAPLVSDNFLGTYHFTTNEDSADWRDSQEISLIITKDVITYHAEGCQIDQTYLLTGTDNGATLKLRYKSAKDGTESAVLNKTKDFGTIIKDGKVYKWACPYIDVSFGNGKSKSYTLTQK